MPIAKPEKTDIDRNKIDNALNFILNEKFITVVEHYKAETQKNVASVDEGLNIFAIISTNKQINETFQNKLLHAILNHTCQNHSGKKIFLHKFIEHINQLPKLPNKDEEPSKNNLITPSDFEDACVEREKYYRDSTGKMWIDVLITSKRRRKAIIIESKLNYAKDQYRQIPRYYDAVVKHKYEVVRIIYIPRNERKGPDRTTWTETDKENVNSKLQIFPSYDEKDLDLEKWLVACEKLYSENDLMNSGEQNNESRNAATILNQYGAWLQAERRNDMDKQLKRDSYKKLLDEKVSRSLLEGVQQVGCGLAEGEAHFIFNEWKDTFRDAGFTDESELTIENTDDHWWIYFKGFMIKQGDKTRKQKLEVWIQLAMPEDSEYSYRVFVAASNGTQKDFKKLIHTIRKNKDEWSDDGWSFYHDISRGESLKAEQEELEECLKNLLNKLKPFKA